MQHLQHTSLSALAILLLAGCADANTVNTPEPLSQKPVVDATADNSEISKPANKNTLPAVFVYSAVNVPTVDRASSGVLEYTDEGCLYVVNQDITYTPVFYSPSVTWDESESALTVGTEVFRDGDRIEARGTILDISEYEASDLVAPYKIDCERKQGRQFVF